MLPIKGRVKILGLLTVFAALWALAPVIEAGQVNLTSANLPYTARSGDTISISGTRITTTGNAIYVPDYVNNTVFEFGTDTLEFGSGGGGSQYGIRFNNANDITVNGGTILRRVGNGPDDGVGNYCVYMTSYTRNITFNNTNLIIDGHNAHVVKSYGPIAELTFNGGIWRSNSQSFTSRHVYNGCVAFLEGASGSGAFDFLIKNVTVEYGPAQGIIVHRARAIIDSCTVTTDHINIGVPTQNANQYAIILNNCYAGTKVTNSSIISGSLRGGSRGILIENTNGNAQEHVLVRNNTLDVHNGPDAESYGGSCRAIRLRSIDGNLVSYVDVYKNTIVTTADTDPATSHIGAETIGLDIKMFSSTSHPAHHIRVDSNTVYARSLSSNANAKAASPIAYGTVDTSGLSFAYNKLYSCGTILRLADEGNGIACRDLVFRKNTLGFMDISASTGNDSLAYANPATWVLGMHPGDQLPTGTGNVSIDAIYVNSASDSDIGFLANPAPADLTQCRTLRVYVRGNNGDPVEGASVTVRNGYNQTVLSGTTNNGGRVMGIVSYRFESATQTDSTGFNNFNITASRSGDSDTHTSFQVSAYAEGGRDTLDFSATPGTGTWVDDDDDEAPSDIDTIPPGPVEDLDASCGPTDNSVVLAWIASGDDGPFGTATRYEIGYSTGPISEGNFASVDKMAAPPSPLPTGASQSTTVNGLPASATYYFAIRAFDEVDNSSELSTSPVFRPYDVSVPIAASETVDDPNQLVTLHAQTVEACLDVHCQFQIDSQESFATAQSATDETVSSTASAVIPGLADNTVYYWRCRTIAADGSDTSAFSQSRAFMPFVDLPSGCAVPIVMSPTDGASTGTDQPLLTVANINTELTNTYFFELDDDTSFGNLLASGIVNQDEGESTSWRVTTSLSMGLTYYWRVRVNNCEYSDDMQFTISPMTSAPAPSTFAYPNPLKLSTDSEIRFVNVPLGANLTIMTVSGDIVRELDNEGEVEVVWDGRNQSGNLVASGTYLWFVEDTGTRGKLIVVR